MKNNKYIIIAIDERKIKVSKITKQKNLYFLDDCFVIDYSPSSINDDLTKILPKKNERVILLFPRKYFLLRYIDFPKSTLPEIEKMIPFQLSKVVPGSLDNIKYDYSVINEDDQLSKLIVFLTQKNKLANFSNFLKLNKLFPDTTTISSYGLYAWVLGRDNIFLPDKEQIAAIVDIDKNFSQVIVCDKSKLYFSRSFSFDNDSQLIEGVDQSLAIFKKEFNQSNVDKIIFTGIYNKRAISATKGYEISYVDCFDSLKAKDGLFDKVKADFSFASLIFDPEKIKSDIDFSFDFVNDQKKKSLKIKKAVNVAVIAFEIIFLIALGCIHYLYKRNQYLNFIDAKLESIMGKVREVDKFSSKLKVLEKEFFNRESSAKVLYEVVSAVEDGIKFTLLDFQENSSFHIKGYANSISQAVALESALKSKNIFKNVAVKYAYKVNHKGNKRVEFYIYGERR